MNALSICILHSKILTSIMISGVWFWLDACLLSSGYDHHLTCDLIEAFQDHSPQDQVVETPTRYVASVEEMAYIGGI